MPACAGSTCPVGRGETVALLGPNGAGKSTTLDMLLGLTKPDAGSVSIFGNEPRAAIAAGEVGAMLQMGSLIGDLSVRELVSMMASLYSRPLEIDDVLELTGTEEFAGQRTQKLSGGQTQRVRLALALVSDPELLVLDEPTVALDVEARRGFWAGMRSFAAEGKTVIFATHYLEEADAYADRVVLMARGRWWPMGRPRRSRRGSAHARSARRCRALRTRSSLNCRGLQGERHGATVILTATDSDAAIRALLDRYDDTRDIEIAGADLEQAFLALTSDQIGPAGRGRRCPHEVCRLHPLRAALRAIRNRRVVIFALAFP